MVNPISSRTLSSDSPLRTAAPARSVSSPDRDSARITSWNRKFVVVAMARRTSRSANECFACGHTRCQAPDQARCNATRLPTMFVFRCMGRTSLSLTIRACRAVSISCDFT